MENDLINLIEPIKPGESKDFKVENASEYAYYLRQGLAYARTNNVKPYCHLHVTLKTNPEDNVLTVTRKKAWNPSPLNGMPNRFPDVYTLSDIIITISQFPNATEFEFPNAELTESEHKDLGDFGDANDYVWIPEEMKMERRLNRGL